MCRHCGAFLAQSTCQILRRANHVSTVITGGQDTVGLRVPNHPVALELLRHRLYSGLIN
ncbi:Sua5/YciO/YrdC/YwlC family protein [Acidithiobacillus ferriphilus]|uniref:Sua5/YciO/YrdC/YwlC family protein n=1 Tax=Acidithiobacillus ferriphilus TaxID=1689834 RepID=UPI0027E0F3F7|nr:Sua5/YciO/YrdC/YwlC family protein [Acidithiobacillus ferriphilus]